MVLGLDRPNWIRTSGIVNLTVKQARLPREGAQNRQKLAKNSAKGKGSKAKAAQEHHNLTTSDLLVKSIEFVYAHTQHCMCTIKYLSTLSTLYDSPRFNFLVTPAWPGYPWVPDLFN